MNPDWFSADVLTQQIGCRRGLSHLPSIHSSELMILDTSHHCLLATKLGRAGLNWRTQCQLAVFENLGALLRSTGVIGTGQRKQIKMRP